MLLHSNFFMSLHCLEVHKRHKKREFCEITYEVRALMRKLSSLRTSLAPGNLRWVSKKFPEILVKDVPIGFWGIRIVLLAFQGDDAVSKDV